MKPIVTFYFLLFGITSFSQNAGLDSNFIEIKTVNSSEDFHRLQEYISEYDSKPKSERDLWTPSFLEILENTKSWARKYGSQDEKILGDYFLIRYHDFHINDDTVIEIGKRLIEQPRFLDLPESVYTLSALNSSYGRKGYYQHQLEILNTLISQNIKFNYILWPETYAYFNELALVYYKLEQYGLARNNFEKQAEIFRVADDNFRTSSMYNNIGLTYAKELKNDSAINFFNKALTLINQKPINDHYYSPTYTAYFKKIVEANKIKANLPDVDFKIAEKVLKEVLASSKSVKERSTTAESYKDLANLYYLYGRLQLAQTYNDSSLIFERQFKNPKNRELALLLKTKLAIAQNENDQALRHLDLTVSLKDSLNKAEQEKNFSEATAKYNFLKINEALEENKKLLQQKEKSNFLQQVFLAIIILFVVIIASMLFLARKKNRIIENQKTALQKGLKEKEIMLDEIHHRIKNNLQVVSGILELQKDKMGSGEPSKVFEESQDYLQSMAMIHQLLYEQEGVTTLDMQIYLERLGSLLLRNYPQARVDFEAQASTVYLNVKTATPLALIICELITNSLKHAFSDSGKINIALEKNDGYYELKYSDNGKGSEKFVNPAYYNTGLNLVKMLAEDLDGDILFFNQNGFNCLFKFKD